VASDNDAPVIESDGQGLVIEYGKESAPLPKLTERQRLFCAEYMKDHNGKQAAIRAGYSEHTAAVQACDLLTRPHLQVEIQRLADKRLARCGVTVDYVLNGIVETVERCMQARPVLDKKGRQLTEEDPETGEARPLWTFDAANVLRGKELLGRYLNMFGNKAGDSERNGAPLAVININTTPEEAARIYKDMIER
jgi:phage terminase small subunit